MIIIPNEGDKTENHKGAFEEQTPQDPPPTYTSLQSSSALPVPGPPSSSYTPINAVNYVSISRTHSHIKENLTVNPSLYIPESLRVPLAEGESERSRKNVKLETVHGHIDAEILLVQSKVALETRSPQRATLQATSTHGGIKVTIPDHPHRPPFVLHAKSRNGGMRLTLPRSFTGPVTVSYEHGGVKTSGLGRQFITLSEANGTMKGFIGDLSKYTEDNGEEKGWKGDELVLDLKHGNVKLRFDREKDDSDLGSTAGGEESPQQTNGKRSIFSKIFGLP